jgi:hypothetical protein
MAKYERTLSGNFSDFLNHLHRDITQGSASATYEDGSDFSAGQVKMAVRVYERYSMIGKNRVSMNISVLDDGHKLHVSAITSGGSQAMFFKLNTWGEDAFLDQCINSIERYVSRS